MAEDRITAALRGPQPPRGNMLDAPSASLGMGSSTEQPDGTAQSGYAPPDLGPFECDNCVHFDGQGRCNNPQVISDPEVKGQVDAEGCCNLFKSAHKETQESEHNEGNEQE